MKLPGHLVAPLAPAGLIPAATLGSELYTVVYYNLMRITHYANDFGASVSLLDYSIARREQGQLYNHLIGVAGRDGALSLYHFYVALKAVVGGLNSVEALRKQPNINALTLARRGFEKRFPDAERVRTSVAHIADFTKNWKKFSDNLQHQNGGMLFGPGGVDPTTRIYTSWFKPRGGKKSVPCSYDLTFDALQCLVEIVRGVHRLLSAPRSPLHRGPHRLT